MPGNSGTDGPPGPLPGWGGVRGVQINLDAAGNGLSHEWIRNPGQVQWFQINGAHGGKMEIVVEGGNDLVSFLTVFRSDGSPVDTDGEADDGVARVCIDVADQETIIAAVSSSEGRSTGPFTITVLQPPACVADDHGDTKGKAVV